MKPITISSKQLKTALFYWLCSFGISYLLNIFSIIYYKTRWTELFTQLGYVLVLSMVIYFLIVVLRALFVIGKRIIIKH